MEFGKRNYAGYGNWEKGFSERDELNLNPLNRSFYNETNRDCENSFYRSFANVEKVFHEDEKPH